MKSASYKFVAFLMLGALIFGCSQKAVVSRDEIINKHDILVVPFKSPPIAIVDWGAGTFLLGGAVGAAAVDAATSEGREKIVDTLNKNAAQWQDSFPEIRKVAVHGSRRLPHGSAKRTEGQTKVLAVTNCRR